MVDRWQGDNRADERWAWAAMGHEAEMKKGLLGQRWSDESLELQGVKCELGADIWWGSWGTTEVDVVSVRPASNFSSDILRMTWGDQ